MVILSIQLKHRYCEILEYVPAVLAKKSDIFIRQKDYDGESHAVDALFKLALVTDTFLVHEWAWIIISIWSATTAYGNVVWPEQPEISKIAPDFLTLFQRKIRLILGEIGSLAAAGFQRHCCAAGVLEARPQATIIRVAVLHCGDSAPVIGLLIGKCLCTLAQKEVVWMGALGTQSRRCAAALGSLHVHKAFFALKDVGVIASLLVM